MMITTDNLGQVWWCPPRAICSSHTPWSLCSTTLEMSGLMIPAQGYLSQPESLVFVLQTTETWSGRTRNSKSLTKLLLRVECLHLQDNSWRCTNIFCDHIICNLYFTHPAVHTLRLLAYMVKYSLFNSFQINQYFSAHNFMNFLNFHFLPFLIIDTPNLILLQS